MSPAKWSFGFSGDFFRKSPCVFPSSSKGGARQRPFRAEDRMGIFAIFQFGARFPYRPLTHIIAFQFAVSEPLLTGRPILSHVSGPSF